MGGPTPGSLPQVVYSRVTGAELEALSREKSSTNNRQIAEFGFNHIDDEWSLPDQYVRWVQPVESELSKQVEYDMDDVDKVWLDAVNADRRRAGDDQVSYEIFEVIMDRLEKEWFDLMARVPKSSAPIPVGESACAICDDGDCEASNAIVFCDGCNLAVHQDCYGVPYIPEGQWLCRKCTVSPDKPVKCVLCPAEAGAFKQTTQSSWAHLLCAIWVPETGVSNTIYMEPVDGVEMIPKNRWRLVCYLCKRRVGACIQCSNRACYTAFHVTCARDYGLYLKLKVQHRDGEILHDNKAFCHKHGPDGPLPTAAQSAQLAATQNSDDPLLLTPAPHTAKPSASTSKPVSRKPSSFLDDIPVRVRGGPNSRANKVSRAYSSGFKAGPPVVPEHIFARIVDYLEKIKFRRKSYFISSVCRYWSMKREARRGAPILKRLHLEPWTASSAADQRQSEVEKAQKLQLILRLRNDLERVRMLTELVRKREREKKRRAELQRGVIERAVFPHTVALRSALEQFVAMDRSGLFLEPVSPTIVPDYYDVVKEPMDWTTMSEKLDALDHKSAAEFVADFRRVISGAVLYNKPDTTFHKAALRIDKAAESVLPPLLELDRPDSLASIKAAEMYDALDDQAVEELFKFDYPVPSPTPPPEPAPVAKKLKPNGVTPRKTRGQAAQEPETAEDDAEVDPKAVRREADAERRRAKKEKKQAVKDKAKERRSAARTPVVETPSPRKGKAEPAVVKKGKLNDLQSFSRFDKGWILPDGASRRSAPVKKKVSKKPAPTPAAPVARPRPPPNKRGRSDEPASPRKRAKVEPEPGSEVEEVEDEAVENEGEPDEWPDPSIPSGKITANVARQRLNELAPSVIVDGKTDLSEGTLVWARVTGTPYWPSECVPSNDRTVPKNIRALPHDKQDVLVYFFDKPQRTWQWIPRKDLKLLGEAKDYDEVLLSRHQVKDRKRLAKIRSMYQWASKISETQL